jgi:hypothetical protein
LFLGSRKALFFLKKKLNMLGLSLQVSMWDLIKALADRNAGDKHNEEAMGLMEAQRREYCIIAPSHLRIGEAITEDIMFLREERWPNSRGGRVQVPRAPVPKNTASSSGKPASTKAQLYKQQVLPYCSAELNLSLTACAAAPRRSCTRSRFSICWRFSYKSTNTDAVQAAYCADAGGAAAAQGGGGKTRRGGAQAAARVLEHQGQSAEGAGGGHREAAQGRRGAQEGMRAGSRFACCTCDLPALLAPTLKY